MSSATTKTPDSPGTRSSASPSASLRLMCLFMSFAIAPAAAPAAAPPAGLVLEIADNGGTADPIDIESLPVSSTGLRGIRARAERLGGSLEVDSGETGVTVIVRIPERPGRRVR